MGFKFLQKLSNNTSAQAFLGTENAEVALLVCLEDVMSSCACVMHAVGTLLGRRQLQLYCSRKKV